MSPKKYLIYHLEIPSLQLLNISTFEDKKLSVGHAKILIGLDNIEFVAKKIIEKNLSVRQAENLVKIFKTKKNQIKFQKNSNILSLENSIREKIGLNVYIKNK